MRAHHIHTVLVVAAVAAAQLGFGHEPGERRGPADVAAGAVPTAGAATTARAPLPARTAAATRPAPAPLPAPAPRAIQPPDPNVAAAHVRAALEAMGGEDALRGLQSIRIEGITHIFMLEQSERFEGPWIVQYDRFQELRDLAGARVRRTDRILFGQLPDWTPPRTVIIDDGVAATPRGDGFVPGRPIAVEHAEARLALAPERVLLLALDAPDLRERPDTIYDGVPHHVVAFHWKDTRVRLFLNAYTDLPTAVETTRAYTADYFWDVWGDVTFRTVYSYWTLEPGGIRYPRQADVEWSGFPYRTTTITALELNAPAPPDSFAIPATAREAYHTALAAARGPKTVGLGEAWIATRKLPASHELADGVVVIPGGYYTMLIRQSDGVVVIEAPFSSEYSAKVLAEAARRFPGVPVKAVVSTGDAWTYMGGVREYVARGIPVYALDLNRAALETLVGRPHTLDPDSLARAPRAPKFEWVSGRTVVGSGPNRLEIHPFRGESGERMMAVYFPEHRLLWSSDLIQPMPDGSFFMLQYVSEVVDLVEREGLDVETVLGMHLAPRPWREAVEAVEGVRGGV